MKVVLAIVPDPHAEKAYFPPLGILHLAGFIEASGHETAVVEGTGRSVEETAAEILSFDPGIIGIAALTENRFEARRLAEILKGATGAPIVAGGPHFGLTAADAIREIEAIDCVVVGEGEETFLELIRTPARAWIGIRGTVTRGEDGPITAPSRPLAPDLGRLSPAAHHLIETRKAGRFGEILRIGRGMGPDARRSCMTIITSRGCPYNCSYCPNEPLWNRTVRFRPMDQVMEEIETLVDRGVESLAVIDDNFATSERHVRAFIEGLRERSISLPWICQSRAETASPELFEAMREAGCMAVLFGLESGSPGILARMGKRMDLRRFRESVRTALETDLIVKISYITGYPGEREEDLSMTFDLLGELKAMGGKRVLASGGDLIVLPGTKVEEELRDSGFLGPDFSWNRPPERGGDPRPIILHSPHPPELIAAGMARAGLVPGLFERLRGGISRRLDHLLGGLGIDASSRLRRRIRISALG